MGQSTSDKRRIYIMFGKVAKGDEIVKKIESVAITTVGPYRDVPKIDVVIQKVELIKRGK